MSLKVVQFVWAVALVALVVVVAAGLGLEAGPVADSEAVGAAALHRMYDMMFVFGSKVGSGMIG
jgi:hypothetical protein